MSSTHNNPPIITPKLGERVWMHLTGPIKLFDFGACALKTFVQGDYPATWMENRFRGRKSLVLFIDNTDVGVTEEDLNIFISQNLITIVEQ